MPPPGAAATVPTATPPIDVASAPPADAGNPALQAQAPASAPALATANPVPAGQPAAANAVPAPAAAASAPQAAVSGAIDANAVVAFRTTGESWIQVTDATGKNVFRKLMTAGESGSASGALPLSVTVGNAEATGVQVRGQSYDLAPVTRGHVARFQVK